MQMLPKNFSVYLFRFGCFFVIATLLQFYAAQHFFVYLEIEKRLNMKKDDLMPMRCNNS